MKRDRYWCLQELSTQTKGDRFENGSSKYWLALIARHSDIEHTLN